MGAGGAKIWAQVTALGKLPGVTDLGQGYPDMPGSTVARTVAAELATAGADVDPRLSQYSAIPGTPRLTAAVASHYNARYGCDYQPGSNVLITTSGTEALYCAVMVRAEGIERDGRQVLACDPCTDNPTACSLRQ